MVEGEVVRLVADTCGVRENHFQCDRGVGEVGVADCETDQIANIVIERDESLLDKLHQRGRCERFRDRRNTHKVVVSERSLALQILVAERLVIDYFAIFDYGSRDADSLKLFEDLVDCLIGLLGGECRATRRKQQCGGRDCHKKLVDTHIRWFLG